MEIQNRVWATLGFKGTTMSGGSDMDGKMTFTHTDYERFLDLKRLRHGSKVSRSRRKIHNRYVFGAYSSIASRLMYDLTDDVAEVLTGSSSK